MNEVLEFLKESNIFYIATVEENKPKVRPFSFITEHEGKLYLCTGNQKDVYKQLRSNPNLAITAFSKGEWIRLSGKTVFDGNMGAKEIAILDPTVSKVYGKASNPTFEVFYIEDGEATIQSFAGERKEFKLS